MEVNNFTNKSNEEQEQDNERLFSTKALTDFKLIDRAINGDEKAYAELMRRYKKSVYHTLLKMVRNPDDADDLTVEAFAKAFKNLPKFKKEYTFSTWLFRIATNNCIDFIRRKRLETTSISSGFSDEHGEPIDIDIRDENMNPQEKAINLQKIEIVRTMVTLLPDKYRQLVQLRYFEELSYEEIAQQLNAPLGTVKAQLHRARELLYDIARSKKDMI